MRLRDVLTLTLTLTLTLIVVLLSCPSISGLAAPEAGEAVAVVCWITGEATVERPTAAGVEPLAVLDRLAPGSVVRTAPASEVTVVFFDGRRFAIGAASRVAIRADDAQSEAGSVRILDPVPAVAELARLARSENPGKRPGAGRIRHTGTSDTTFELYPRDGAALLSAAAILRFTPIAGVEEYRVEVIDEADEEVFAVETAATEVPVPAGVLQPGIMYGWRVRSLDRGRLILHGEALFVTLSDQNARARRRLAERAADADDPGLRLLLAAVDRSLGLWRDACDGVLSVAARAPGNAAVHRALERFECSKWRSVGAVDSGVVVEELGQGSTLERAGIQAGDLLLSWERPAQFPFDGPSSDIGPKARGEIGSVFDWMWLVIEQAPRGRVLLSGERDGAPKLFEVPMGLWDVVEVRPRMRHALLVAYLRGKEQVEEKDLAQGIPSWERAAESAQARDLACWLRLRAGDAWGKVGEWEKARAAYRSALEQAQTPEAEVTLWDAIGQSYELQSDFAQSEASYREALRIRRETWGESLSLAASQNHVGRMAMRQWRLDFAQEALQDALDIRRKQAPRSLPVAGTLDHLGTVMRDRGNLELAREYHQQAREIQEKLAPKSLGMARSLNRLGIIALDQGPLDLAESYFQRVLELERELAPEGPTLVNALNNLGVVALSRRELDLADDYFRQTLELTEKLAGRCLNMALVLCNLGEVASYRGELERAEDYLRQALEIQEELNPEGAEMAYTLDNLGAVADHRGELHLAQEYYQRALEFKEKLAPESVGMSKTLHSLGNIAVKRGEPELAERYYERAMKLSEPLAPGSLALASTLNALGELAIQRDELERAQPYLERALEIREELAPGSSELATSLKGLGILARRRGELQRAAQYFSRALDTLESQVEKLGGSHDVQAGFRVRTKGYYRDSLDLFLELKHPEQAFAVLERSRARSFLAMLAERDLLFNADLPQQAESARRRIAIEHDKTQQQIASLNPKQDMERLESLLKELRRLTREREDVVARIRETAPHFSALQYPQPLDLRKTRDALDPGTVMLSYSVGEQQCDLFVVTREHGLEVHLLPIGERELRREVDFLRRMIPLARTDSPSAPDLVPNLERVSQRLYQTLIDPAADRLAESERVLLVPDGPLHLLPFAALIREPGDSAAASGTIRRYLGEWKPLHSALSATVYAQLKQSRPQPGRDEGGAAAPVQLAAFGDPHFPKSLREQRENIADVELRSAVGRGLDLEPLPFSRREVEGIAESFPAEARRIYLGKDATEERAKGTDRAVRYLHFATHGLLDPRFPLNSGLALTIPEEFREGRDNGLLQAWEIFESVRLNADLVVLSACDSGLGKEQGGEGLIGLSRAFQYAGARSVAATLWEVEDAVTAELMVRFYRYLRAGRSKDEALRAAQLELIRAPIRVQDESGETQEIDASAPYYWAAFQIIGDWR